MTLFFLIGLVLTGGCGVLVLRAVTLPRARRRETLAQIGAYGFHGVAPGPTIQSRSLREILEGTTLEALVEDRLPAEVRRLASSPDAWVSLGRVRRSHRSSGEDAAPSLAGSPKGG